MTKLSDTQRVILSAAAQDEMGLATAPKTLPAAARDAVCRSLTKNNLLTEIKAPRDFVGLGWRQDDDGTWVRARITDEGLRAIGPARARVKIGLVNLTCNMRRLVWLNRKDVPAQRLGARQRGAVLPQSAFKRPAVRRTRTTSLPSGIYAVRMRREPGLMEVCNYVRLSLADLQTLWVETADEARARKTRTAREWAAA